MSSLNKSPRGSIEHEPGQPDKPRNRLREAGPTHTP